MPKLVGRKTEVAAKIISDNFKYKFKNVLVVGCGLGLESAILAQQLKAKVVGIDIVEHFDADASQFAELRKGDAMELDFDDASFDLIYSYHSLEHISDPLQTLKEMNRVLIDGGGCFIGVPNRRRIIGYLGSTNTLWVEKIRWNIFDWKAKMSGEFKNELGAHAGFSSHELHSLIKKIFSDVINITNTYYLELYKKYYFLINFIVLLGLSKFFYPGVYFIGIKSGSRKA